VCAAGTGSFLDQQAYRLNMAIDQFGPLALQSTAPVRIAGRCTVFAESDMIHKQQRGHRVEDILYGLCQALARNFLNNLCLGKDTKPPVVFQGGVAANAGMIRAFEETPGRQDHRPAASRHHGRDRCRFADPRTAYRCRRGPRRQRVQGLVHCRGQLPDLIFRVPGVLESVRDRLHCPRCSGHRALR